VFLSFEMAGYIRAERWEQLLTQIRTNTFPDTELKLSVCRLPFASFTLIRCKPIFDSHDRDD